MRRHTGSIQNIEAECRYIAAGIIHTNALSGFHDEYCQNIGSKKNTVVSDYAKLSKSADRVLGKMIEKLDKILDSE